LRRRRSRKGADGERAFIADKGFGASLLHGLPSCGVYEINMGEKGVHEDGGRR
jgi:hypothetical protein